jgi:glycosyltransferase involved in cell wall biosynthesis
MWPWFHRSHDRWINRKLLTRSLAPLVARMPGKRIAVTTIPIIADLVGRLPVDRWVYYCVDDFNTWPGLDHLAIQQMEEELIRRVDVLIAVSNTLSCKLASRHEDAQVPVLTHGVDLEFWRADGRLQRYLLDEYPRPRVVFWGLIDQRIDPNFVQRLAADMNQGQIILVGPQQDPDPGLLSQARVVHVPAVPMKALPQVAAQADALIMPYADSNVTRAMQPLKLKEYLATGKAVIVRDIPATRHWADCLDIARSPEEFSSLVRARLRTGPLEEQLRARQRLVNESWAAKAKAFHQYIVS